MSAQPDLFGPLAEDACEAPPTDARLDVLRTFDEEFVRFMAWQRGAMEAAEDAIEAAAERYPDRAELLDRAFRVLQPRYDLMGRVDVHVIRAHMDELLRRIGEAGAAAGLEVATAAEACVALGHLSQAAPLRRRHQTAYEICFIDALGEEVARRVLGEEIVRRAEMDRDDQLVAEVVDEVKH
ncbi:MAG: hypothetical protein ACODAA_08865, partial [Gemmatimonadota bacterium]